MVSPCPGYVRPRRQLYGRASPRSQPYPSKTHKKQTSKGTEMNIKKWTFPLVLCTTAMLVSKVSHFFFVASFKEFRSSLKVSQFCSTSESQVLDKSRFYSTSSIRRFSPGKIWGKNTELFPAEFRPPGIKPLKVTSSWEILFATIQLLSKIMLI